ncbi:MAG: lysine--tRNA ligase [Planctomycetes bacterium]|nr:lysine--tRNA ligase [Planctomycetota bacterium]
MSDSPDQYREARRTKARRLTELGVDPFGSRFDTTHTVADARDLAPALVVGADGKPGDQPRGSLVRVAGRLGNLRSSGGKLKFATLYDRSRGEVYRKQVLARTVDIDGAEAKKSRGIQLYLEFGTLGEGAWALVEALDLADWVGVVGHVGRTRRGEISVFVTEIRILGKAMLPPPHQAGADSGALSPETRSRQRYLDLMMSDASLSTFMVRSRLVAAVRRFFTDRGFLEVETPMMHPILGGATAKPFVTHHNALDLDLYLRIAPELYLKRLLVGGLERVFECNRNFRNEGISPRHNPEFTMIEWYQAYADHGAMMDLSEELFRHLADTVIGTRTLHYAGIDIDLAKPWRRISYHDALREFAGLAYDDRSAVEAAARSHGLDPAGFGSYDRLANEVWEILVEPHLIQPTFITDQPSWLTPLCKAHPDDPGKTLRFELFIARMEIGNAYTELNDPDLQRQRFRDQAIEASASQDDEAKAVSGLVDEDYCTALDFGLPACGGQGIGIDRLAMLFTGESNIRDVILFPTMRPSGSQD